MTAPVFGQVDPLDYQAPLCHCGHEYGEHDGEGDPQGREPCWADWTGSEDGCLCEDWRPDPKTGRGRV